MGDEASGVGSDDGDEAMAVWAALGQTERTKTEIENQGIQQEINRTLARDG